MVWELPWNFLNKTIKTTAIYVKSQVCLVGAKYDADSAIGNKKMCSGCQSEKMLSKYSN